MSLIYITGIAGSGKTTMIYALRERGYEAYDVDSDGFAQWVDKDGRLVAQPGSAEERTEAWSKLHDWQIIGEEIIKLAEASKDKLVFLGGVADKQESFFDYFDKLIYLEVSRATLEKRLRARTGNDFGKSEHEFQSAMRWYGPSQEIARRHGMTFISGEQAIVKVIKEVLAVAKSSETPPR